MTQEISDIQTFDPVWEEKYASGHNVRAPWDVAVSFIFRFMPRQKPRSDIKILEVGCGPGSNLWFAAMEGFDVYGVDGSESAITIAQERFSADGLAGTLEVGDFTCLQFEDNMFDLVIDRGSLTCAGTRAQKQAIQDIHRTLKPGGYFLYTPFADTHHSRECGQSGADDVVTNIRGGTMQGVGQLRFVSREEISQFLPEDLWKIEVFEYHTFEDLYNPDQGLHSSWKIVAQKR